MGREFKEQRLNENERGLYRFGRRRQLEGEVGIVDVGMTRVVISVATRYCHQGRKGRVVTAGRKAF